MLKISSFMPCLLILFFVCGPASNRLLFATGAPRVISTQEPKILRTGEPAPVQEGSSGRSGHPTALGTRLSLCDHRQLLQTPKYLHLEPHTVCCCLRLQMKPGLAKPYMA